MAASDDDNVESSDLLANNVCSNDDAINGTVYSKAWALSLMVKIVEMIQNEEGTTSHDEKDINELSSPSRITSISSGQTATVNFNSKDTYNESDLCHLWDISADQNVALFLNEHNIVQLIVGVITRTSCNRLTEGCVGILNNIACVKSLCAENFNDISIVDMFVSMLAHSGSRVLTELTRLMITCLSCDKIKMVWLEGFRLSADPVLENLTFILYSSTNEDLLGNISILLDVLLDQDEYFLVVWGNSVDLIKGICEAINQCGTRYAVYCSFIMSIQLFTTTQTSSQALLEVADVVYDKAVKLLQISESEKLSSSNGGEDHKRAVESSRSLLDFFHKNNILKL